jgi:hypothetical protein
MSDGYSRNNEIGRAAEDFPDLTLTPVFIRPDGWQTGTAR